MTDAEYTALRDDIAAHGQRDPVWIYEAQILDGRHRARAVAELAKQGHAIELKTQEFDGDDALAFVLSANLRRRHLNESQRAMSAARVATLPDGGAMYRKNGAPRGAPSQNEAAALFGVGRRSVQRARVVLDAGDLTTDLVEAIEAGEMTVKPAAKEAKLRLAAQAATREHIDEHLAAKAAAVAQQAEELAGVQAAGAAEQSVYRPPADVLAYQPIALSLGAALRLARELKQSSARPIAPMPVAQQLAADALELLTLTKEFLHESERSAVSELEETRQAA